MPYPDLNTSSLGVRNHGLFILASFSLCAILAPNRLLSLRCFKKKSVNSYAEPQCSQLAFGGLEKVKGNVESWYNIQAQLYEPSLWIILAQIIGFKNGLWMLHFWVCCTGQYLKFHSLLWAAFPLAQSSLTCSSRVNLLGHREERRGDGEGVSQGIIFSI